MQWLQSGPGQQEQARALWGFGELQERGPGCVQKQLRHHSHEVSALSPGLEDLQAGRNGEAVPEGLRLLGRHREQVLLAGA